MALSTAHHCAEGVLLKPRRWLGAITLKATNELYQKCAEHALIASLY
jgi:hypothetical protein